MTDGPIILPYKSCSGAKRTPRSGAKVEKADERSGHFRSENSRPLQLKDQVRVQFAYLLAIMRILSDP